MQSWIKELSAGLTVAQRLLSQVSVKPTTDNMSRLLSTLEIVALMISRLQEVNSDKA